MRIGSSQDYLELVPGAPGHAVEATLVAPGLRATCLVGPHYADDGFGDLLDFFADLERSWRGSLEERREESLDQRP